MGETSTVAVGEWRCLSLWSVFHFGSKAVLRNLQALLFFGPATYGASRFANELAWMIPIAAIAAVLIGAAVSYLFYSYRILDDRVQVRRGMLRKTNLNLAFGRIQNISIEHPFYFRPLSRVTLKIDGAGAKGEEVNIAALTIAEAEAARNHILRRKSSLGAPAGGATAAAEPPWVEDAAPFFTRSLLDLVVHGLTNNRAFIAIAGLLGILWQRNVSSGDLLAWLGMEFDLVIAGMSLARLTVLFVLGFIAAVGATALLSVLVAIFTYYGFSIYRTADGLTVQRGLLTRHEIHVKKSRIQTVTIRQDWLDRLLGRRNVILERISHSPTQQRRIFVPSVREHETRAITEELLPGCRIDDLPFTPIRLHYFYKRAVIATVPILAAVGVAAWLAGGLPWVALGLLAVWPFVIAHLYLSWKHGGLAVHGDFVVARSGTVGIDYRIFPAHKAQDVTHIQSVLMRRRDVSTLRFHTASTTITVPYMGTEFMRAVLDYVVFRVESSGASWM